MADPPRYLVRAREIQESVQHDACRIQRSSTVFDRETGKDVEAWELVYEGPCRFPRADAAGRVIVTGETITPASPTVKIPWHVEGVRPDDRVTCTESVSPAMVGRILWVTDTSPRTFQSAVNLTCREVR
jgi:hypothetical protein